MTHTALSRHLQTLKGSTYISSMVSLSKTLISKSTWGAQFYLRAATFRVGVARPHNHSLENVNEVKQLCILTSSSSSFYCCVISRLPEGGAKNCTTGPKVTFLKITIFFWITSKPSRAPAGMPGILSPSAP